MSPLISPALLTNWLEQGDVVIFDCRFELSDPSAGRRHYEAGHIQGAWFADLNADLSDLSKPGHGRHPLPEPEQLGEFLNARGVARATRVVAYDAKDSLFASRLWWLLGWLGHSQRFVLDGGLARWCGEGHATSTESPAWPQAQALAYRADSTQLIESDVVHAALKRGQLNLIDARGAPRFQGLTEPLDRIAGHVPGARNRPHSENLDASGRFKSESALAAEWAALERDPIQQPLAVMCGSGVTACHHLLARAHAGLAPALLYADSWSGWISDPDRPIATGP